MWEDLNPMKVIVEKKKGKLRSEKIKAIIYHRDFYIMLIPCIIYFLIYKYGPMFGIMIAFQDYYPGRGILNSSWVGFKHFERLFTSNAFWMIMRNTLTISLYRIFFGFPAPILLALLINELHNLKFKRIVQTISYLPHFISMVIMAGIIKNVFSMDGPVNQIIELFGGNKTLFLASTSHFRSILVGTGIYGSVGWGTIVYLAAISGISQELYEAALADGAGRFRRIWHITLPAIRGVIVILLILRVGDILEAGFMQILLLYNPIVYRVADVIDTYVFRVGLEQRQYSFTTAVGVFKSVIGLIMVGGANMLSKKLGEATIW